MLILITYDVNTSLNEGQKRLRKVAKECVNFGHRVQNSVFECQLNEVQLIDLKHRLINLIDRQKDSIRFYRLGNNWKGKVDFIGKETAIDMDSTFIV
jgi:CRISPR-associated protein Cas2